MPRLSARILSLVLAAYALHHVVTTTQIIIIGS